MSSVKYTFAEYQAAAARTGGRDLAEGQQEKGLNHAAMGLAGEAGEVCDLVKKSHHYGVPLPEEKLKKELGDVLWYVSHACSVQGWSLEEIAKLNVAKLLERYPNGFSAQESVQKRDEKSNDEPAREALERLAKMILETTILRVTCDYAMHHELASHFRVHTSDKVWDRLTEAAYAALDRGEKRE